MSGERNESHVSREGRPWATTEMKLREEKRAQRREGKQIYGGWRAGLGREGTENSKGQHL